MEKEGWPILNLPVFGEIQGGHAVKKCDGDNQVAQKVRLRVTHYQKQKSPLARESQLKLLALPRIVGSIA